MSEENKRNDKEVKLLLLGGGGTGKTTLYRVLKDTFSPDDKERKDWHNLLCGNVLHFITLLVSILHHRKLQYSNPNNNQVESKFLSVIQNHEEDDTWPTIPQHLIKEDIEDISEVFERDDHLVDYIESIWRDGAIQDLYWNCFYSNTFQFQINQNMPRLLDNLKKITRGEFGIQDALYCRVQTKEHRELVFTHDGVTFRTLDIGGDKAERPKWSTYYPKTKLVLFFVSLSEFNEWDDESSNRMHDSLQLANIVFNCRWFWTSKVVLVFTNYQHFVEKLTKVKLMCCFPEYKGDNSASSAMNCIVQKFLDESTRKERIPVCLVDATNAEQTITVMKSITNMMKGIETCGEQCIASGDGVVSASTDLPTHFSIQAKRADGSSIDHGGDWFLVYGDGAVMKEVKVMDNKNGTYGVTYTVSNTADSSFQLNVKHSGSHIVGSPFTVTLK